MTNIKELEEAHEQARKTVGRILQDSGATARERGNAYLALANVADVLQMARAAVERERKAAEAEQEIREINAIAGEISRISEIEVSNYVAKSIAKRLHALGARIELK
jgi:hypothetical protein